MKNSVSVKVMKDTDTICLRFENIKPPLDFSQLVRRLRNTVRGAKWEPNRGWEIPFSELGSVMSFCFTHFPHQRIYITQPHQSVQLAMEYDYD